MVASLSSAIAFVSVVGCGTSDEPSSAPSTPTPEPAASEGPHDDEAPAEAPDEPEEPAEPEPSATDEAPAMPDEEPPRGERIEMPEKMGRRIRNQLRERHHASIELREPIVLRDDAGATTVFALYGYSHYQSCMHDPATADSEDRAMDCQYQVMENAGVEREGDDITGYRVWRSWQVLRADVAPTLEGRPADWGGEITLRETRVGGVTMRAVPSFALRDVDGDGEDELDVELRVTSPVSFYGTGERVPGWQQVRAVYRADLEPQFTRVLLDTTSGRDNETGEATARRLSVRDDDGDGHPDLILETLEWSIWDCDDEGWPTCDGLPEPTREVWRYDAAADTWPDPSPR